MTSYRRPAVLVPLSLLLLAAGTRLWGLSSPAMPYWDEQHYVYDANAYVGGGYGLDVGTPPSVRIADEGTWIHPPLGKWMIALLGIGPFGLTPFGWRFPSAVFGVAGVMLLYLFALELWRSVWWAGFAGGLLLVDGLHVVHSRLAMLDIFLTTFVTAGMFFIVRHRTRRVRDVEQHGGIVRWFGSTDLLMAGVMFGAAVATKWAGCFAAAFAFLLALAWSRTDRAEGEDRLAWIRITLALLVVPIVVYLGSYAVFFVQHGPDLRAFGILQLEMLEYHQQHTQVQPQNSAPWTWPLLLHPIQYYGAERTTAVARILALGNPALWWGFIAATAAAAVTVRRRPCWQDVVAFGGFAALYVPWFFVGRSQFIFYMLPAVPFMCLAVVSTIRHLPGSARRVVGMVFGLAVVLAALAYAPVWTGTWIGRGWLERLRVVPGWDI